MIKIRDQIIAYLEENQTTTAINLAQLLNVTVANVRYHLKILLNERIIEVIDDINLGPRGRPTRIYSLSKNERSIGLNNLLRSTLEEISQIKNNRLKENRLRKLARIIIGISETPAHSLTIKLGNAVSRLNELGYKARWEAHSTSPNIIFHNCPYSSFIDSFPVLCQLDQIILEELLGTKVIQDEKLASFQGKHPFCLFSIK
jgi:predicted ArsR family transcriptional regulator